jgi:nitrogen regulatory protein PII
METHPKKRLEIIVEAPVLKRVLDLLDRLAVTGYTVMPALAGRGRDGRWRREGLVTDAGQMVVIVCILDESRVSDVLDPVFELVSRQIGIVTLSNTWVVRPERF